MKRHAALRALVLAPLLIGACSEAADEPALIGYVEADWIYIAAPQAGWIVEQPVRAGNKEYGQFKVQMSGEVLGAATERQPTTSRRTNPHVAGFVD